MLVCAQVTSERESQLESGVENGAGENGDDEPAQETDQLFRHPLDLNKATAADLERLQILTPVQVQRILRYRELFGPFLSVFELQAVSGCDAQTWRSIRPLVMAGQEKSGLYTLPAEMRSADQRLTLRYVRIAERAAGFMPDSTGKRFAGGAGQWLIRYVAQFKRSWQAGWLGEKDAGESFLKGRRLRGFDFNSFHVFMRDRGRVHALALGDFTVRMGQGLIHWQGAGTGQSSEVMMVAMNAEVLKPYQSAGESSFFRGAGITTDRGHFSMTIFGSYRNKDAILVRDSTGRAVSFSSWNETGLHRTAGEIAGRHGLSVLAAGMVLRFQRKRWKISLNGISFRTGLPMQKREAAYNIYSVRGRSWNNVSVSWAGNTRQCYFFGELAADGSLHPALLTGLILSADPIADISLLYRYIGKAYQAMSGSAFTAGALPSDEEGLYLGLSLRPAMGWTLGFYADLFRHSWLKFNVDGPSVGSAFLAELRFVPDKQLECYTRFRIGVSEVNADQVGGMPVLSRQMRATWRTHAGYKISRDISVRGRVELSASGLRHVVPDRGYLWYTEILYKPLGKPVSVVGRVLYFDTESYAARIYAYEQDVLYSYTLPGFSGRGVKFYVLLSADAGRKLKCWLRLGRLLEQGGSGFGTGVDRISENHRTDLKLEARWLF